MSAIIKIEKSVYKIKLVYGLTFLRKTERGFIMEKSTAEILEILNNAKGFDSSHKRYDDIMAL